MSILGNPICVGGGGGEAWAAISVTYPVGSTCTATNGTTTLTAGDTSGQVVFIVPQPASTPETWTVSCSGGGDSDSKTVSMTAYGQTAIVILEYIKSDLNANPWATISRVAQAGTGDTYWDVGDKKEIILNGAIGSGLTLSNFSTYVFILDFNHADNGVADNNIIFGGFKTSEGTDIALEDDHVGSVSTGTYFSMNHSRQTNVNGWKGCELRYDILGACSGKDSNGTEETITTPVQNTLMAALPSDFRSVLRLRTHYTDNVGNKTTTSSAVTEVIDAGIFLLAEFEILGTRVNANNYEKNKQSQMTYYKNGAGTTKYKYNGTLTTSRWLTSSPYVSGTGAFVRMDTSGSIAGTDTRMSSGLAPAFKV